MKELAIGEELRIRCVEDKTNNGCAECFFLNYECDSIPCTESNRKNGKNVHFELVEN